MANGPEFFQTVMGHKFFEGTVPALVRELKRLNDNLESKNEKGAAQGIPPNHDEQVPGPGPTVDVVGFKKLLTDLAMKECRDLDEQINDFMQNKASDLNNEGLEAQLLFLVEEMGVTGARRWLEKFQ